MTIIRWMRRTTTGRCRIWVINGPDGPEIGLPLSPRKRTQVGHRTMPGSCEDRTCGPPHRDPLMAASEALGGERATSVMTCQS